MPELCRNCERRTQDFGGCRCQAFLLAHDAGATDPVCSLSPQRAIVDKILSDVNAGVDVARVPPAQAEWLYRANAK